MERCTSSFGTPFISISVGSVTNRSISSAAWPGHCVMISTMGGERSGYASTGMCWNDMAPPMTTKAVSIRIRNRCRSANWTMR